ncbi:WSC domain-containing protein [Xylaria sp. FL0064]|nr:WSC domain-containing protein [Xylaria sp. FL0064]
MLRRIPFPLLSLILISSPILPQAKAQPASTDTSSSPSVSTSPPSTSTSTSTSSSTPSPTSTPPLQIPDGSASNYAYAGCWNETYGLAGTNGLRALDGASEVLPGEMTVEKCLDFCAPAYRLAGLEYSRECWCGEELNSLSVRLPDAACDTPCDGANSTACGGALRLTVYNSTAPVKDDESGAGSWRVEGVLGGGVLGTVVLGLAFALG